MVIRPATEADRDALIDLFLEVVRAGDAFAYDPATNRRQAEAYWFAPDMAVYACESDGEVLGSCMIRPNQPGLGDHVANAGFMVTERAKGQGLGREMGLFALQEAVRLGYSAMQFNFVVASNQGALALWHSLGFEIIGRVPKAFRHAQEGPTDVFVMYRSLTTV